ncbi:hypothetical protein WILDE_96 [Arthrobacter phage Wilde]|uniref:Uncharacterized protein n=1 Tax=Arthrobacter phage Wilde TaxID=1772323 RepID=A0A0U4B7Z4_9CAUD|nr:hypothetical protein WILDE_96 [Arthrobacter phage Wilde]
MELILFAAIFTLGMIGLGTLVGVLMCRFIDRKAGK